jgi:dynein heavy chain
MEAYMEKVRTEWVMEWPGQCVLAVSMTYWTSEVHEAIRDGLKAIGKYRDKCTGQIEKIVTIVRGKLPTQIRITLGKYSRHPFLFALNSS